MKYIICKNIEGGISILYPVCSVDLSIEQIIEKDIPKGVEYKIVEKDAIPVDKTFREAWDLDNWNIVVKLDKAKDIWKNKWREARKPKLEALDIEFMRAVELGDFLKQSEVATKKQMLRDVTNTDLSAVSSPEELKNIWPDCLK
jgi:hypothetical protein